MKRAIGVFTEELLDNCSKQTEFRAIAFALAYFHAAVLERKKFGVGNLPHATSGTTDQHVKYAIHKDITLRHCIEAQCIALGIGWNMNYPFNVGDLICCAQCASNYLDNNVKVTSVILRTLIDIMYCPIYNKVERWNHIGM